jgi:sugar lactone lactonase YvrE
MKHIDEPLPPPPQPGINGIRYSAKRQHVYYTNTAQKLFMRVRIDSDTFEPIGAPEPARGGGIYDDFCIDDEKGVAYVTVHRENRIDRAPIEPDGEGRRSRRQDCR